jgi:anti-sigma B factor antagonist
MHRVPPIELTLTIEAVQGGKLVRISGSVGVTEAEILRARLAEVASSGELNIVIDLSEMDFISSPGLTVLLKLAQRARTWEGTVKLLKPRPMIRDLLTRTRLTEIFPVFDSLDQALQG